MPSKGARKFSPVTLRHLQPLFITLLLGARLSLSYCLNSRGQHTRTLALMDAIVDGSNPQETVALHFPGDDLHITDQIIAAIERGAEDFRLPWHRAAGDIMRPVNVASKKPYRGVNVLTLWATADDKGYSAGIWGTYRSAQIAPQAVTRASIFMAYSVGGDSFLRPPVSSLSHASPRA